MTLVSALFVVCLSSCSTPRGADLNRNEQTRLRQQEQQLPDRLNSDQENAFNEAKRKADMIKK